MRFVGQTSLPKSLTQEDVDEAFSLTQEDVAVLRDRDVAQEELPDGRRQQGQPEGEQQPVPPWLARSHRPSQAPTTG